MIDVPAVSAPPRRRPGALVDVAATDVVDTRVATDATPRRFGIVRTARHSSDGRYRYRLGRRWGDRPDGTAGRGILVWVMLNPSTADAEVDDPTVRRVIGLSRAWGWAGCEVVNLFAWRSSRPSGLAGAGDPVGPGNRAAWRQALALAPPGGPVVAAWGAWSVPTVPVAVQAAALLRSVDRRGLHAVAVGESRRGHPRHPLYVSREATPARYGAGCRTAEHGA